MGSWEESPFAIGGGQLDVQEALVAIERVLAGETVKPCTRVALAAAARALRSEG